MSRRNGFFILGVALVLVGIFLPTDWYNSLPKSIELPPPPVSGLSLLRVSLFIDGLLFVVLSLTKWKFAQINPTERLSTTAVFEENDSGYTCRYTLFLAVITTLALFLRLVYLNSDLWIDEITTISRYGDMSALEVLATYTSSNNHLLNTLLVKLAVRIFGENEWAVRLPAVIFGVATIPAIYWVSRLALSRRVSLYVALLLAVSYHHVFFSQNARGYTAYLFFSLVSSGLLVRGLQEDRARVWVFYVATMLLNFASLLTSFFVFASHILVGAATLFALRRRGVSPTPLSKRLGVVFAATAFLGFQLYAMVLPQVYVVMQTVYTDPAAGYSAFSGEFIKEMVRGVTAGFGTGLILGAIPFLVIAGVGFVEVFRHQWTLALALVAPLVLTAAWLIVNRLIVSPRFFLLALPPAVICVVQGVYSFASLIQRFLGKREVSFQARLTAVAVLILSIISLASLKYYYTVPKQAYRASIQYLKEERKPGDIIIVIHLAETGYRYYGRSLGLVDGKDYFFVRSMESLDSVLSSHPGKSSFLVTTFPRALRISHPDLNERIAKGWISVRTFPATVGDGEISIWKNR